MRTSILCSMALVLLATACGAGESLSPDEKTWCLGNADRVESAARDLELLGFIGVYYETEGDGLGPDGRPIMTDRNEAATEQLRTRNTGDPGVVLYDLFSRYLRHPDGQTACNAASADNI
ncbi:MAG: hypothetical protein ACNYZH_00845 [Acidimicrobiia bacterium]